MQAEQGRRQALPLQTVDVIGQQQEHAEVMVSIRKAQNFGWRTSSRVLKLKDWRLKISSAQTLLVLCNESAELEVLKGLKATAGLKVIGST